MLNLDRAIHRARIVDHLGSSTLVLTASLVIALFTQSWQLVHALAGITLLVSFAASLAYLVAAIWPERAFSPLSARPGRDAFGRRFRGVMLRHALLTFAATVLSALSCSFTNFGSL
jgi:hypothetical protein